MRFIPLTCAMVLLLCSGTLHAEGTSFQLDNDLFSVRHSDCDYSFGAAMTFSLPRGSATLRSTQVGVLGMTPLDLTSGDAQANDRPYASLVAVTTSRINVSEDARRASHSSLTVGALGLRVAEQLQKGVHRHMGGEDPQGWRHQISDGGEPTARFVRAAQWLLGAQQPIGRDVKLTLAGSAGYLTEASVALSMRFGQLQSPWWQFAPELADYMPAPVAPAPANISARPERYVFLGARVKARGYDALVQGQFRASDVRIASDDLERLQAEAWAGLASTWAGWRLTYTLRVASKEISRGNAARTLVWGGLNVDRAF